jgi:hypothetical protein
MTMNHSACCQGSSSRTKKLVPLLIGLVVLGAIVAYELGYGAALLKFFPLLLFAACPLMHLFMHHHGHDHQSADGRPVEVKALPGHRHS